jgi:hypothetical protein
MYKAELEDNDGNLVLILYSRDDIPLLLRLAGQVIHGPQLVNGTKSWVLKISKAEDQR